MDEPTLPPQAKATLNAVNAEGLTILQKLATSKWGGIIMLLWTVVCVGFGFWAGLKP